jgi:hypothetical protein
MRDNPVLFRSQYERKIREWLEVYGHPFKYEPKVLALTVAETGDVFCGACSSKQIWRRTTYTPDFYFPETGVYMEAKGKFDPRARKVALAVKDQWPLLDYRILLQRDNWMTGKKVRRYSDWLKKHEIPFAVGKYPPLDWVRAWVNATPGSSAQSSEAPSGAARFGSRGKRRRKS